MVASQAMEVQKVHVVRDQKLSWPPSSVAQSTAIEVYRDHSVELSQPPYQRGFPQGRVVTVGRRVLKSPGAVLIPSGCEDVVGPFGQNLAASAGPAGPGTVGLGPGFGEEVDVVGSGSTCFLFFGRGGVGGLTSAGTSGREAGSAFA